MSAAESLHDEIRVTNRVGTDSCLLCFRHAPCAAPTIATHLDPDHESSSAVLRRWGTWAAVLLDESVRPGHTVGLRVTDSTGKPLAVNAPHFVDGGRPPIERAPTLPEPIGVRLDGAAPTEPPESRPLRLLEIESLDAAPGDLDRHGWMWWHIDVNTHQDLLRRRRPSVRWPWGVGTPEAELRSRSVEIVAEWLAQRVQRRWDLAGSDPDADLSTVRAAVADVQPRSVRVIDRHLSWIELLLRTIVAAHHPPAGADTGVHADPTGHGWRRAPAPNLRSWASSCLSFALGDLQMTVDDRRGHGELLKRVPMTLGHPDSVAFVLLAEFALATIEADLAAGWWRSVAGALIAATGPYAHAWGRDGVAISPRSYDAPPDRVPRATEPNRRAAWLEEMARPLDDESERAFGARLRALMSEPITPDSPWARRGRS